MNKQLQGGFIAYAVMVALGIILIGGSFYYYSRSGNGLSEMQKEAKMNLDSEATSLYALKARYKAEREAISKIKDEYSSVRRNILAKTDIFFSNANSEDPRIKIKISDKSVEAEINKKRLQITKMLEAWELKNEIINSDSLYQDLLPTLNDLVKSAEQDMAYIRQYVKELEVIINNLSPNNSNLTQAQIIALESIIEDSNEYIQESISVISEIQAEIPVPTNPVVVVQETGTTTQASSTGASMPTTTPPPVVYPPIVTLTEIQTQEKKVEEAKKALESITATTTSPVTTTPTTTPPVNTDPIHVITLPTTIIYYLPPSNIDYTGWPDIAPDTNVSKPLLLQGSD